MKNMKDMKNLGGSPACLQVLHALLGRGSLIIIAAAVAAACTSGPPPPPTDPAAYERAIAAERVRKDNAFRAPDNRDSPILPADRRAFAGLSYYPVDPKYHVPASLNEERPNPPIVIDLQTSINTKRRMRKAGTLTFRVDGTAYTLTAFADVDARVPTRLFVPFGDLTNVDATYRGGRYLDLDRTPTGLYDLDFNRAYHPYCVFNPTYECPVPPRENRLTIAILAGERLTAQ
jgi:uncharacterized protein (DUF1684 family)